MYCACLRSFLHNLFVFSAKRLSVMLTATIGKGKKLVVHPNCNLMSHRTYPRPLCLNWDSGIFGLGNKSWKNGHPKKPIAETTLYTGRLPSRFPKNNTKVPASTGKTGKMRLPFPVREFLNFTRKSENFGSDSKKSGKILSEKFFYVACMIIVVSTQTFPKN